jgi:hypothetical protein
MVFFAEQELGKPLPETLDVEVALDRPRVTNRNLPALLGDHDGHRVGFFG